MTALPVRAAVPFVTVLRTTAATAFTILLLAGCSAPDTTSTPETRDQPPAVMERAETPAEPSATPNALPTEDAATAEAAPDSAAEEAPLPEVLAVDTKQLEGLLNKARGKVTILNVWATFCVPCLHEMPDLVAFYNETNRDHIALVSLAIDDVAEITDGIPKFQKQFQMPFPVYVLNERNDEGMLKAIRGPFEGVVPSTYLYDREGNRVHSVSGDVVTLDQLRAMVEPLVKDTATEATQE